jgi:hypothetical protein
LKENIINLENEKLLLKQHLEKLKSQLKKTQESLALNQSSIIIQKFYHYLFNILYIILFKFILLFYFFY